MRRPFALCAGVALLTLIVLAVLAGPLLWSVPPERMDLAARNAGASLAHPLGTDQLGRDLLARLMAGGRISLAVGGAAMLAAVALGTVIGVVAGMVRWLDGPLMRLTDLFLSLPLLPLALIAVTLFRAPLAAALGPEAGLFALIVGVIAATSWMQTARVLRGEVLALMARSFIAAARSAGTPPLALATRHILPNVASAIAVSATLAVAGAIITESTLSFLGVGFPPDFPSWGRLLADGTAYLGDRPGRALWPGALISLTVLAVAYIGDALRDRSDPRGPR
ncbi:ABC transporter permease [Roseovarius spongiae]|uniref:ABC transporter permease n=1 Tax=Roseovarius spongiae TaxID=2320272 RepID=A0A3A8B9Q0_9RHOB|nr:ABC transporter permease [Roseovarius spongiae]RKF14973.1 ABC transporter permease [Roseovarius spongiae]